MAASTCCCVHWLPQSTGQPLVLNDRSIGAAGCSLAKPLGHMSPMNLPISSLTGISGGNRSEVEMTLSTSSR